MTKDARDALEELANMPLGIPLEDWARLSARILAALEPAALAPTDAAQERECAECGERDPRWQSACPLSYCPHVNKTPKSEHDAGNVLTAAQAQSPCPYGATGDDCCGGYCDMDDDQKGGDAFAGHGVQAPDATSPGVTAGADAAQAREAAFLGVCECGMTGPCMWDQCKHPLNSEARDD